MSSNHISLQSIDSFPHPYTVLYITGGRQAYFLQMNLFIQRVLRHLTHINSLHYYCILQHRYRPKNLSFKTGHDISLRNPPGKVFQHTLPKTKTSSHPYSWKLFSNSTQETYTLWSDKPLNHQNHTTTKSLLQHSHDIMFLSNYLTLPPYFNDYQDKFKLYVQHLPQYDYPFHSKHVIHHNNQDYHYTHYDYSVVYKSKDISKPDDLNFKKYFI